MNRNCDEYRHLMPQALLEDLPKDEQTDLDGHLETCEDCRKEMTGYRETFEQLNSVEQVPVPRHFYVDARDQSRWTRISQRLGAVALPWRLAAAASVVLIVGVTSLALSGFRFQAENGIYTFSFGKALPSQSDRVRTDQAIETLRTELKSYVEQAVMAERRHYLAALRDEVERTKGQLTAQQAGFLQAAINQAESRLTNRMVAADAALENKTVNSIDTVYQAIQAQRGEDLLRIRDTIVQTARRSEAKDRQTQAVLATLIEATDLRMRGINE